MKEHADDQTRNSYSRIVSHRIFKPALIVAVVLLANILTLSGFTNSNPIINTSGIGVIKQSNILGGQDSIDPNDGITTQSLGHQAATQILHGHLPWWNYYEQLGAPLAGGIQSAALFPFVLILALSNGVLLLHIILEIIAGVATYYLLKRLKLRDGVSLTGGILFALNGTFAWLGNAIVNPIAFLPLILLGLEIAFDKASNKHKRGWFLLAIGVALSIYAGFPEVAALDLLLAALWFIVRAIQLRKGAWRNYVYKAATGAIVGLFIAAPIIIAFLDYLPHSYLGVLNVDFGHNILSRNSLPALFFPYIYGTIFGYLRSDHGNLILSLWDNIGGYLSLTLAFFALLGVFGRKSRPLKIALLFWIILGVARVYNILYVTSLLKIVPFLNSIAVYRYIQPSFELAAVILAMFGLERVISKREPITKKQILLSCSIISLIVIALIPTILSARKELALSHHHDYVMAASVAWEFLCIAIIAFVLFSKVKYKTAICSIVLIANVALLFAIPGLSAPRSATIDMKPVKFLQANLGTYRFYSLGPLGPNYGSYFNIASIDTNNLPISKSWERYLVASVDTNTNPVIFGGTFALKLNGPTAQEELIDHLSAYEHVNVKYVIAAPNTLTQSQVNKASMKPVFADSTAIIYQLPNPAPYYSVARGSCTISNETLASINVNCSKPSQLIRQEIYMPGWKVKAGSNEIAVNKSGPLFQSVKLPPGSYKVTFNFLPPHMYDALIIFAVGWVAVAGSYLSTDKLKKISSTFLRGILVRR